MRSYEQHCGLARALDIVGDRWTLLIVRELLIRERCRYTDLRYGLPGIATNLLADRLRELEANGIVTREDAPPPIAATLFRLTPRGEALKPVIAALGMWGAPLLHDEHGEPVFRSHWLVLPLELLLRDHEPGAPAVTIAIETGEQPLVLKTSADGGVHVEPGRTDHADATLGGDPTVVMDVLTRGLELAAARRQGLRFSGDPDALRRVAVPASEVVGA